MYFVVIYAFFARVIETFGNLTIPHICHESHENSRVNIFGRCKFLQIQREKLAFSTDFTQKSDVFFTDLTRKIGVFRCKFYSPKNFARVKKLTNIRYERHMWDILNIEYLKC